MRVKTIRPAGRADVYNMEVDETHSFVIAGGLVAHNCYDELRYVAMENPVNPPLTRTEPPKPYNPLESEDKSQNNKYAFFRR